MIHTQNGFETEEYLIAGLLLCKDRVVVQSILTSVSSEWFVSAECRRMFEHLSVVDEEEISPIRLNQKFSNDPAWKDEQFRLWLYRITETYPSGAFAGKFRSCADQMASAYRARQFLAVTSSGRIAAEQDPESDYIERTEGAIHQLRAIGCNGKSELFSHQVLDMVDQIESGSTEDAGLTTGISGLDYLTGSFKPSQLIVVGARPSVGKSMFGVSVMMHNARRGKTCYFATLEMEKGEVIQRLLANESGAAIVHGKRQQRSLRDAALKVADYKIHIDDRSTLTTVDIANSVKALGHVDLVVVDYLQLLVPADKQEVREQQVSRMSRELKQLAGEVRAPVILMSQLNRKAAEGTPQLSHLRESGAIEQDANLVLMLDRETDEEALIIWVRKNRTGRVGHVDAKFDGPASRITASGF